MQNPFTRALKDPETGRIDPKEVWARVRSGLAVLLSLAVLLGGGWFVYGTAKDAWVAYRTIEDYIDEDGTADVTIEIPEKASLAKIGDILLQADVIKTAKAFDRAVAANEAAAKKIQFGQYKLRTQVPAKTALTMLLDPKNQIHNRFQIPEGLRLSQILPILAKATGVPVKDFQAALKDRKALGLPDWLGKSNEGFIFPDTYDLPAKPTALNVLKMTTNRFLNVLDDVNFEARARSLGVSPYQALTMASLIEKEVFRDADRAKVARVFYNRVAKKMALQSDATVAYANNVTGRIWTTDKERALDSPYNTYLGKNAGKLPPGPITAPARKALDAAVAPAEGKWLYFVPVNLDTGETEFNESYAKHLEAVAKLQAWCTASDANRKKCS